MIDRESNHENLFLNRNFVKVTGNVHANEKNAAYIVNRGAMAQCL